MRRQIGTQRVFVGTGRRSLPARLVTASSERVSTRDLSDNGISARVSPVVTQRPQETAPITKPKTQEILSAPTAKKSGSTVMETPVKFAVSEDTSQSSKSLPSAIGDPNKIKEILETPQPVFVEKIDENGKDYSPKEQFSDYQGPAIPYSKWGLQAGPPENAIHPERWYHPQPVHIRESWEESDLQANEPASWGLIAPGDNSRGSTPFNYDIGTRLYDNDIEGEPWKIDSYDYISAREFGNMIMDHDDGNFSKEGFKQTLKDYGVWESPDISHIPEKGERVKVGRRAVDTADLEETKQMLLSYLDNKNSVTWDDVKGSIIRTKYGDTAPDNPGNWNANSSYDKKYLETQAAGAKGDHTETRCHEATSIYSTLDGLLGRELSEKYTAQYMTSVDPKTTKRFDRIQGATKEVGPKLKDIMPEYKSQQDVLKDYWQKADQFYISVGKEGDWSERWGLVSPDETKTKESKAIPQKASTIKSKKEVSSEVAIDTMKVDFSSKGAGKTINTEMPAEIASTFSEEGSSISKGIVSLPKNEIVRETIQNSKTRIPRELLFEENSIVEEKDIDEVPLFTYKGKEKKKKSDLRLSTVIKSSFSLPVGMKRVL